MQKFKALAIVMGLVWLLPLSGVAAKTVAAVATPVAPAVEAASTMKNLLIAYSREINDQAWYLAFAERAQTEGYLRVAGLFRATAMAKGIQAASFAKVIKSMGGTPEAGLQTPLVDNTNVILVVALAGEKSRVETIYPEAIKQAELEKNIQAVHAFGGAKVVEGNHAKLFSQALHELAVWKADGDFFVCKICGNVVTKLDFEYCVVCKAPVSEFEKVK